MSKRDLSLSARREDIRPKNEDAVLRFSISQIKEHFDKAVEEAKSQFQLFELLLEQGKEEASKEILRSQVVFLESALDFYIHEISKLGMVNIFVGEWDKTKRYENFKIPMKSVEEALKKEESTDWLFEHLNERFGHDVYLGYEPMKDQLNMLGLEMQSVLQAAFPGRDGQKIITDLYNRRNQIAHQSDRKHSNAEKEDITRAFVQQCLLDVTVLVDTIHNFAAQKAIHTN